jgi:hypothetical protein
MSSNLRVLCVCLSLVLPTDQIVQQITLDENF